MDTRTIDILLVEDSPGAVRLTTEAMREAGVCHRLSVAPDGAAALAFLRRLEPYGQAQRPDIILLDLNLPRMDGGQILAEIKADPDLRTIPVVVLTTSAAEADVLAAYNLHANCYIIKPVDLDQFIRVVQSLDTFWSHIVTLPPR